MWPVAAAVVAVILTTAPSDRTLVCRSQVAGAPAFGRAEALAAAVRDLGDRVLDYGVPCPSAAEAARAAARAGVGHAVAVEVEGLADEARFGLTVVESSGRVVAVRRLAIGPGDGPARALAGALSSLVAELPRPAAARARRRTALGIAGAGLVAVAAGGVLAGVARAEAERANAAQDPAEYLIARSRWERTRAWSGAAIGVGGAAALAGLAWRLELGGER